VAAEQPVAIPGLLAGLARRLGIPEQADQAELLASLWDELRGRERWLLVYDNAQGPRELAPYRPPAGGGRVLVTSRTPTWGRSAATVRLDVLDHEEAVAFLRQRTAHPDTATLAALAEAVGDLPLALEQAAAYLDQTRSTPAEYLALFWEHGAELLALGEPLTTEQTVATTWQVALDQLGATPGALELLGLCAFLAPDDIPRGVLGEHSGVLPEPLRSTVGRQLTYNQAVSALGRYSLVTVTEDALTMHPLVQAVVRHALDDDQAKEWARAAVALVEASFPDEAEEVTAWPVAAGLLAHALAAAGHAERLDAAPGPTAGLLTRAARYLRGRAEYAQAKVVFARALGIYEAHLGPSNPATATARSNLALVLTDLRELPAARANFERVLAHREAVFGPDHPATAQTLNNLANVLRDLGELPAARALHERALAIRQARLGPDDPATGHSWNNLAGVLHRLGELPAARAHHERALAVFETQLGPDHPTTAASHSNLGIVLTALGELPAARAHRERALAIREARLGPDHPDTADSLTNLGLVLAGLGKLPAARVHAERGLAIREARLGPDHPDTADSLIHLALVLDGLGELPAARGHLERALAIGEARLGPDHPLTATARSELATVRAALDDAEQA
jgi:tetratricopeptide (TPR) repeat protein